MAQLTFTIEVQEAPFNGKRIARIQHFPGPGQDRLPMEYGMGDTIEQACHNAITDMLTGLVINGKEEQAS